MIHCYRCDCDTQASYQCLKDDLIVYSCPSHVIDEPNSLQIEYNNSFDVALSAMRILVAKKKKLLDLVNKTMKNWKRIKTPHASVKTKNPSNQFILSGFVNLRQIAGQKQDRNHAHMLKLGIRALQKYPVPIIHPEQALDLQGIGRCLLKSLYTIFRNNKVPYKSLKSQDKTPLYPTIPSNILTIKLCIDQRETRNNNFEELATKNNIPYIIRTLSLGDFIFVAEYNESIYVLDVVIERKCSSDLSSSHFSNHLRDQIRRLKSSSCKTKILLIEGKIKFDIVNEMWLLHGIKVVVLSSYKRTMKFLKSFYEHYHRCYGEVTMLERLEKLEVFQEKHRNNDCVGEIFYKQILEFPYIGPRRLGLFVSLYPTMIDFLRCYKEDKELVHQNIVWCGINPSLELAIYGFFGIRR